MAASIARKTGKVIGIIVAILVVFILALVAFLTVTEYNPPATQEIEIHGVARKRLSPDKASGRHLERRRRLSRQADFFMDGGDGVRTVSHDGILANLRHRRRTRRPRPRRYLSAGRSGFRAHAWHQRTARLATAFAPEYASAYALNFDVAYVPYPCRPSAPSRRHYDALAHAAEQRRTRAAPLPSLLARAPRATSNAACSSSASPLPVTPSSCS